MKSQDVQALHGRMLKSARVLQAYFENRLKTQFQLIFSKPEPIVGERYFPFHRDIQVLGIWGYHTATALTNADKDEVNQTFRTILAPIGRIDHQQSDVVRLQQHLEVAVGGEVANVIPIRRAQLRQGGLTFRTTDEDRRTLRHDCLIEAKYISEIHKMAIELHSHGDRYAFFEFRDLTPHSRRSLPELASLGAVSLFIPDVLALHPDEQLVLKDLVQLDSATRPLILAGSTLPFSELRNEPDLNVEFLTLLARAYIKLSRPFIEYKRENLIHYFLDSLS